MANTGLGNPFSEDTGRSYVRSIGMVRDVKVYPLIESELASLTLFNGLTTASISIGSTFLLFGIGLMFDALVQGILTEEAQIALRVAIPFCLVIGTIALVIAFFSWMYRRSMLKDILKESRVN